MLRIESIAYDNFPSPIGSALLEVVAIGYSLIIVTATASSFGTVRFFAVDAEGASIETFQNNLFMRRNLGIDRRRIKKEKKENHPYVEQGHCNYFQNRITSRGIF